MAPPWLNACLEVPSARWIESVRFWSAVTGMALSPPRGEREQFVTLVPAEGSCWVKLRSVDGPSPGVHLDLDSVDRPTSVRHSVVGGVTTPPNGKDVPVVRSPGGLSLCHTLAGSGDPPHLHRGEADLVLDQVCIDIPPRYWHSEVSFWQTVTGRDLENGLRPEFAFLGDRVDPAGTPRILLQRLNTDALTVTAHLDFAVRDRAAQARVHERHGATVVAEFAQWTVLAAPSGHRYCLTDRDPATGSVHRDRDVR